MNATLKATHEGTTVLITGNKAQIFKFIAVNGWNKKERISTRNFAPVGWNAEDVNGNHRGMMFGHSPLNVKLFESEWTFACRWSELEIKPHEFNGHCG